MPDDTKWWDDEHTNQVILQGYLTTAPECRTYGSGASTARLLITTRLQSPRSRTDVIPVTVWEPAQEIREAGRNRPVQVTGQVHRRFWTDAEGRHSRVEVVASQVRLGPARVLSGDAGKREGATP